jgi:hypothetical protein
MSWRGWPDTRDSAWQAGARALPGNPPLSGMGGCQLILQANAPKSKHQGFPGSYRKVRPPTRAAAARTSTGQTSASRLR